MSQLVITETMRAILVYMGSDPSKPVTIGAICEAMHPIPTFKVIAAIVRMEQDKLAVNYCIVGIELTASGRIVAANIIELTRNRGK